MEYYVNHIPLCCYLLVSCRSRVNWCSSSSHQTHRVVIFFICLIANGECTIISVNVERKVSKYENHKLRERKVKTLTRNRRDHKRDRHTRKLYRDISTGTAVFVVCSQIFTLFRLRKTAVPVKISRFSFRVFVCACPFCDLFNSW